MHRLIATIVGRHTAGESNWIAVGPLRYCTFPHVRFPHDWELNLGAGPWSLRIARRQLTLWRNYAPAFWFFPGTRRVGVDARALLHGADRHLAPPDA